MRFATASFTEAGPRTVNEDKVGVWTLRNGGLAVAIADGLGGMGGGDIASQLAIKLFGEDHVFFASDYPHERARADFLPDIPGLAAREDVSDSAKRKIFRKMPRGSTD